MNLADYVDEEHIEMLALAEKTDLGRAIIEACKRRSARVVAELRRNPKISPENIRDGISFKLGQSEEVEFIPELIKECQRDLTKN